MLDALPDESEIVMLWIYDDDDLMISTAEPRCSVLISQMDDLDALSE